MEWLTGLADIAVIATAIMLSYEFFDKHSWLRQTARDIEEDIERDHKS